MVIGFDAIKVMKDDDEWAAYGRAVVEAIAVTYPTHHHLLLYTPRVAEKNTALTSLLAHTRVRVKEQKRGISGWMWRHGSGMLSQLRRHDVSVFHGIAGFLPSGIKRSHIAAVVSIPGTDLLDDDSNLNGLQRWMLKRRTANACDRANRVIVTSEVDKRFIMDMFGVSEEKIDVIPLPYKSAYEADVDQDGCDDARRSYGVPERFMLYQGPINEESGLETVVRAMPVLKGRHVRLVIVGHGGDYYRDTLKPLAHELHVEHALIRVSRLHRADAPALMHAATAMIVPPVTGTRVGTLEAQVSGTIPIGIKGSPSLDAGGDAVIAVPEDDVETMKQQLLRVFGEDADVTELVAACRANAANYSQAAIADRLLHCYRRAMDN